MNEFAFFAGKEDRWDDSMRALWGNLSICPCLDYLELPYHTSEELPSICCFKVWGNTQEPCNNMTHPPLHTEDPSEAKSYGMAPAWTSPHQAWAPTTEEVPGTPSTCTSSGPDQLHTPAQSREGPSHTPPPKDKHPGVLPQGKVEESPHGWTSQPKVHQPLSAGPQAIHPAGLNVGNSRSPSTYQNCYIAALASLSMSTHIWELTLPHPPPRSQSMQLCHQAERMLLQQPPHPKLPRNPGSPWWQRLMTY